MSKKLIHLMERSSTIQEVVSAFVAICFGVTLRDRTWTRRCDNKAKEPFYYFGLFCVSLGPRPNSRKSWTVVSFRNPETELSTAGQRADFRTSSSGHTHDCPQDFFLFLYCEDMNFVNWTPNLQACQALCIYTLRRTVSIFSVKQQLLKTLTEIFASNLSKCTPKPSNELSYTISSMP